MATAKSSRVVQYHIKCTNCGDWFILERKSGRNVRDAFCSHCGFEHKEIEPFEDHEPGTVSAEGYAAVAREEVQKYIQTVRDVRRELALERDRKKLADEVLRRAHYELDLLERSLMLDNIEAAVDGGDRGYLKPVQELRDIIAKTRAHIHSLFSPEAIKSGVSDKNLMRSLSFSSEGDVALGVSLLDIKDFESKKQKENKVRVVKKKQEPAPEVTEKTKKTKKEVKKPARTRKKKKKDD